MFFTEMKDLFAKPGNPESFLASAMSSEMIGIDGRRARWSQAAEHAP